MQNLIPSTVGRNHHHKITTCFHFQITSVSFLGGRGGFTPRGGRGFSPGGRGRGE